MKYPFRRVRISLFSRGPLVQAGAHLLRNFLILPRRRSFRSFDSNSIRLFPFSSFSPLEPRCVFFTSLWKPDPATSGLSRPERKFNRHTLWRSNRRVRSWPKLCPSFCKVSRVHVDWKFHNLKISLLNERAISLSLIYTHTHTARENVLNVYSHALASQEYWNSVVSREIKVGASIGDQG